MAGNDPRTYFRPDIEGLRAVAIVAVLLFHAGVPGAEGGFIGVDVFFVISGFLITGLLVREWQGQGRVDLVLFYARRFRRLLPAALLVIGVTLLASWFVLSSLRFPGVAGDAAAAALYVSNIRFAADAIDYLGAEVAPSPLLHFWSLGVEEQFYLFWPLIIALCLRLMRPGRLGLVVGLMAIASFWLALVWTDIAAPWAFFSLPTRAWQLGVGALIAVGLLRLPGRTPHLAASGLTWLGLAVIVVGVVTIDAETPYPGLSATIPVLGAALVIIGGGQAATMPGRLLSTAVPRWIGRISYSLYLWHWPILVLAPIALGVDSLALNLLLVLVAAGIAWASTEFIESPIRHGRLLPMPPRRSVLAAAVASIAVAAGALAAGLSVMGPTASPTVAVERSVELPAPVRSGPVPDDLVPALAGAYYDLPSGYADDCHLDFPEVEPPECVYGLEGAGTTVLLLGDSHAQQWLPALEALAADRDWRVRAITKAACPMIDATVWNHPLKREYRECDIWRERALRLIEEEEPAMVLVASADMYDLVGTDGQRLGSSAGEVWATALHSYLERIRERAPLVVVLADTPRLAYDPAECLASNPDIESCEAGRSEMVDRDYAELEAAAAAEAGAALVSPADWLCFEDDCPLVRGSYLVYRDRHHLTATFATRLAERLGVAIDVATGGAGGR